MALLAPFAVRAGFTHTGTINSSGRKHLSNGYVYTVANDVTIKAGAGLSGIYLDANSTAVLYMPSGVTLKVQGGAGQGTSGAGAGIEVPSSSTLVVTGGGKLEAAVAFDGLPEYYGTAGIYADADGKAYLWLPEDCTTPVTPKFMSASPKKGLLGASSGTTHTFAANGYNYTVTIDPSSGSSVAERGEPLQLDGLRIDGFAVEDGWLLVSLTASPATWLYGFVDTLSVRASATLPIPDDAKLDLSAAERRLEGGDRAVFAVPLEPATGSMFFTVGLDGAKTNQ